MRAGGASLEGIRNARCPIRAHVARLLLVAALATALVVACGKKETAPAAKPPVEVSVVTVAPRDTPAVFEYVAQTQSSRQVNIQARVSGFLDKRVYTEGSIVKEGQVLFLMDKKPFQAQVDAAKAQLSKSQAALEVAKSNLARVKPLTEKEALSQKDLDDATGNFESAAASVDGAKAQLETAQLNLSYCTITSPVAGISGAAAQADGTYLNQTEQPAHHRGGAVADVGELQPVRERAAELARPGRASGQLRRAPDDSYVVEIVLVDGPVFPCTGRITFTDPVFNAQTGTFLVRVSVDNPAGLLRPNQYVRVRVKGATRPNAILVPQRAVLQGSKGPLRVGRRQGRQGGKPPGHRGRLGRRRLGDHRGPARRRPGGRRRRPRARAGAALNPKPAAAGPAASPAKPLPAKAAAPTAK